MEITKTKVGEKLSFTHYVEVVSKGNGKVPSIEVKDGAGKQFTIQGQSLLDSIDSASQYSSEKKVNRTDAIETLLNARDSVFTVVYDKADGSERTLTGRLIGSENHLGRSNVIDLEVTNGANTRQVDHRTLKSLILRGVKYTVKK